MAGASVKFDIIGNDRASSAFDKVGHSADDTTSKFSKMGRVAKVAGAALLTGLTAAVAGGGYALKAASDLNETISKSKVIFGKQYDEMNRWSKGAATALGMSRKEALDSAAGFGDMFRQIGFTDKAAGRMSRSTVKMAADFGSFNNLPTAEVADAISGAFRGEYDSLQRLIPNISAARVEQKALAMTGKATTKELTAQDKAAAALAIMHKDGARAMGDFKRTSGGLANQQKILRAQFDNTVAAIGSKLLPVAVKFGSWLLNRFIPAISKAGSWINSHLIQPFKRAASSIGETGQPLQKFGSWITTKVLPAVGKMGDFIQQKAKPALKALRDAFANDINPALKKAAPDLATVGRFLLKMAGAGVKVAGVFLSKVLPPLIRLTGVIFGKVVPALARFVAGAIRISGAIRAFGARLLEGAKKAADFARKVGVSIGRAVLFVKSIPGKVKAVFSSAGSWLVNAGSRLIQGLINGIKSKIGALGSAMGALAAKAKRFLPGSPVAEGPLMSWNNGGAGKRLVGLLADGLRDTAPVDAAMRHLTSRMTFADPMVRTGVVAGRGSVASSGYGGGGVDARALADAVAEALGDVEFRLRGDELVGVIRRYDRRILGKR